MQDCVSYDIFMQKMDYQCYYLTHYLKDWRKGEKGNWQEVDFKEKRTRAQTNPVVDWQKRKVY